MSNPARCSFLEAKSMKLYLEIVGEANNSAHFALTTF